MKYIYLSVFFGLIFFDQIFAQSYLGYSFIPTEYGQFNEITGGTLSTATGNDGAQNINLPFPFQYMGITYTTARISVNGWLEMGQTYTGAGYNNELESTVKKPFICPLWEDIYADSQSEIRYETIGAYPARIFVVQWKNILLTSGERKSFQVRLWEIDGTIDFVYGPGPTYSGYDSFSIGMNNQIGGPGNFISVTILGQNSYSVDTMTANNTNNDVSLLTDGMFLSFVPVSGRHEAYLYQTPDSVIVGNPNQKIIAIIMPCHAGGVLTTPWVTQFNFDTYGTTNTSDLLNAKLFATGEYPYFSSNNQLGPAFQNPNGLFSIGNFGYYNLYNNASTYFWLAYDISPNAVIGNFVDGSCYRIDRYECCPPVTPDSSMATSHCIISNMGVQGSFTVGLGEDYETLTQAFNFLKGNLLIGQVTLELTDNYNPANETYPIIIPNITNASANNSIIIKPASQNNIIFQCNAASVFNFNNASYTIIDGYDQSSGENKINIINDSSAGSVVYFSDGASFNTVKNCVLQASDTSADGAVVKFFESNNELNVQGNTILNCIISKNDIGEVTSGILFKHELPGQSVNETVAANVIKSCTIKDFAFRGISLENTLNSFHILGNNIFQTSESPLSNVQGIYMEYGATPQNNPDIIEGNKIYNLQPKNVTGNTVTGIIFPGGFSVNAYNNFISLEGNELSRVEGMNFTSYGYLSILHIYYNSIFIYGTNSSDDFSAAFCRSGYASYTKIKNNLLINYKTNSTPNSKNYCVYFDSGYLIPEMNYNDYYYVSGQNNFLAQFNGVDISSLSDWISATSADSNSSFKNVSFVSDTDLHLTGNSLGDTTLIAEPIPEVTIDIDNETRNPSYPYKGADENLEYPLPVEITLFKANVSNSEVRLSWITVSEKNNYGFAIFRSKSNNINWQKIGFIPGNGTTTETHHYSFTDGSIPPGSYQYKLKQLDLNGSFMYSKIINVIVKPPMEFSLSQNYPNPFNPSTKIKYSIPVVNENFASTTKVQLKVYDVLGREVATLVNEYKPAGKYEVEFYGKNLPSGIYFYKLSSGDYNEVKKMLLLK